VARLSLVRLGRSAPHRQVTNRDPPPMQDRLEQVADSAGNPLRGNGATTRSCGPDRGSKLLNDGSGHVCYCEGSDLRVVHVADCSYPVHRLRSGRSRHRPFTRVDASSYYGEATISHEVPARR
jgi:hypothetical protein